MRILKLVIKGRPITKKNSQMIITTPNGQNFLVPGKIYRKYEREALKSIKEQIPMRDNPQDGDFKTIEGSVHIEALYWMPNRRGWPDLLGLEESTADILEGKKAKKGKKSKGPHIISNDRNIISWDGSRLMGVDSENPRVEITIRWEDGK